MDNQSEVARLREQIAVEHRAMVWALEGLREGNIQHAYITRRMGHMEIAYKSLEKIVGEDEAIDIVNEVWETSPKQAH